MSLFYHSPQDIAGAGDSSLRVHQIVIVITTRQDSHNDIVMLADIPQYEPASFRQMMTTILTATRAHHKHINVRSITKPVSTYCCVWSLDNSKTESHMSSPQALNQTFYCLSLASIRQHFTAQRRTANARSSKFKQIWTLYVYCDASAVILAASITHWQFR